jgi:hypothetical protein
VDLGLLEEVGEHLVGDEGVRALGTLHVVTRPQLETLREGLETVRETRLLQHQRVAGRLHRYLGGKGKFVRRWRKLAGNVCEKWKGTFAKIGTQKLAGNVCEKWKGTFAEIGTRKLAGNVCGNWQKNTLCNKECEIPLF